MAVPKGKVSRARRDKRRSSHWKLETPGLVACPKCGAMRLPHRMCKECGYIGSVADAACPKCGGEMYQRDDDNETMDEVQYAKN